MDIAFEALKNIYGLLKVDYRLDEGKKYFIYGFRKDEKEWDYNKGELLIVTNDEKTARSFKEHFFIIPNGDIFCEQCFKEKKVEQLKNPDKKYWGTSVWNGLTKEALIELENYLLVTVNDFSWRNVKGLTLRKDPFVFYSICDSCLKEEAEFYKNENFNHYEKVIDNKVHQLAADSVINGNEALLEQYISHHIELVEKGMTVIECQKRMDGGIIDILAEDTNGNKCVIELKVTNNDKSIVWQSAFYQSEFGEGVRVITIAPDYSLSVYKALSNVKNTELKVFGLNQDGCLQISDYEGPKTDGKIVQLYSDEENSEEAI